MFMSVLIQTIADSLIYRNGFGKYSDKAKEFIDRINARFTKPQQFSDHNI